MKKPLVLAMLSGFILVGAAYPDTHGSGRDREAANADGGQRYRPCRSRRDDRCIQLYERGVSARYARWLRDGDPGFDEAVRYAVYQDSADRRAGMRRGHRERVADRGHHRDHHATAAPRAAPQHARRANTRLAMADVTRCDDHAVRRNIVREHVQRPAARPAARPRMYEDSGVRGM